MDIRKMTDEELARELQRHFDIPIQSLEISKFIHKCVKDSMPTADEMTKIILRWNSIIADKGLATDIAQAIYEAMERK